MNIAYFNGTFVPKENINISPDDRGFLFGDGIYEVMKWYGGFFFDPESHHTRLNRSMREIHIKWPDAERFINIAEELIKSNNLQRSHALIYLQVTRGPAPRNHAFPDPAVEPTVYAFARETEMPGTELLPGVNVLLKKDLRWSRCDIKSISLLPNTLSFQEAHEKGMMECIFVRDGLITEGTRSNIFFVSKNNLYTYPESEYILSGVTRKNIIRFAKESGITVKEEAFPEKDLEMITEAFITNTSAEVTPVIAIGQMKVGKGVPGPVTRQIHKQFMSEIYDLKG